MGGTLVLPAPESETGFAPSVVFDVEPTPPSADTEAGLPVIESIAGSVAVRSDGVAPADRNADILRALGGGA